MFDLLALLTTKEFTTFVVTTVSAFKLAFGLSGYNKSQTLLFAWSTKLVALVA